MERRKFLGIATGAPAAHLFELGIISSEHELLTLGLDLEEEQAAMLREVQYIKQLEGPYPCSES